MSSPIFHQELTTPALAIAGILLYSLTMYGCIFNSTDGGYISDTNYDGLIEISTIEQLDLIRNDLNGDGKPDHSGLEVVKARECGELECKGYRLVSDLNFTDLHGEKWTAIGSAEEPFNARFVGYGHALNSVIIHSESGDGNKYHGLFGAFGPKAVIRNISINGQLIVTEPGSINGLLAGSNKGSIYNITGDISVNIETDDQVTGGLIGEHSGSIKQVSVGTDITLHGSTVNPELSTVGGVIGTIGNQGNGENDLPSAEEIVSETAIETDRLGTIGGIIGSVDASARLSDLRAEGNIAGHGIVGGIIGSAVGPAYDEPIYVSGTESSIQLSGTGRIGGIVGYCSHCDITDTHAEVVINGKKSEALSYANQFDGIIAGGIFGYTSYGSVQYSNSSVEITGTDTRDYIGGLGGGTLTNIHSSYSSGNILFSGGGDILGGLISYSYSTEYHGVSNVYSVVHIGAGDSDQVGGLFGAASTMGINNCYFAGTVYQSASSTATSRIVAGIAGEIIDSSVYKCYLSSAGDNSEPNISTVGTYDFGPIVGSVIAVRYSYGSVVSLYSTAAISNETLWTNDLGSPISDDSLKIIDETDFWSTENWEFGDRNQYPALKDKDGNVMCGQPEPRVSCIQN